MGWREHFCLYNPSSPLALETRLSFLLKTATLARAASGAVRNRVEWTRPGPRPANEDGWTRDTAEKHVEISPVCGPCSVTY